jgi:hypothetical protein
MSCSAIVSEEEEGWECAVLLANHCVQRVSQFEAFPGVLGTTKKLPDVLFPTTRPESNDNLRVFSVM